MDELRFVRRDDLALILANDADQEFRLPVDEAVLAELRHLNRRERGGTTIRPREIQSLLRAGSTRAQVAEATGLDEADVERYEEPVLAERRYIQGLAQDVLVRVDAEIEAPLRFGAVIAERLRSLDADAVEWSAWREDGSGWMVAVEFISRDEARKATWSFDHRKSVLSPTNPDAVNLSKQGEIGDRLIPKLRAVDSDRDAGFDTAFETEEPASADPEPDPHPRIDASVSIDDPDLEYERRREIDQLAVSTEADPGADLSQTADLLDALRRRRGERERDLDAAAERHPSSYGGPKRTDLEEEEEVEAAPSTPRLWSVISRDDEAEELIDDAEEPEARDADEPEDTLVVPEKPEPSRKGRASVPSWDDILFGTRSDEDPA